MHYGRFKYMEDSIIKGQNMENQQIIIVLLVLVVALVGINLFFNFAGITPAGQSRLPVTLPPDPGEPGDGSGSGGPAGGGSIICGNNVCESGENSANCFADCGIYLKDCKLVENTDGNGNSPFYRSAQLLCDAKQFSSCGGGIITTQALYYASINGTCTAPLQSAQMTDEPIFTDCSTTLGTNGFISSCNTQTSGGEPFKGDISYKTGLWGALCCS
ncbi:MAG: hypothetical protein Q7S21_01955 [archaeon]|nr:hypothetical protein [archaeon]